MISFTADFLFNGYHFLPQGSSIEVNDQGEILSLNQSGRKEKIHMKGLLMPGMINAHCHLELSHLKGKIPKKTGLIPFLQAVMLERSVEPEVAVACALEAEEEMWSKGIVAVGDICNTSITVALKNQKRLHYHSFVELIGLNPTKAAHIVGEGRQLKEKFERASLALHAPYSITPELLNLTDFSNGGDILSMHHEESAEEIFLFERKHSGFISFLEAILKQPYQPRFQEESPTQATLPSLQYSNPILLVHNTFTTEKDLDIIKNSKRDIYLCACLAANLYIENRLPDIPKWLEKNIPLVLGTDSLASNDELSIMQEVLLLHRSFPEVSKEVWLQAATLTGAKALDMNKELGSFEPKKNPGLIQIENWEELMRESSFLESPIIKRWF